VGAGTGRLTVKCPECGKDSEGVGHIADTRLIDSGSTVRRRRRCLSCEHRWTTYEVSRETAGAIGRSGLYAMSANGLDVTTDELERILVDVPLSMLLEVASRKAAAIAQP